MTKKRLEYGFVVIALFIVHIFLIDYVSYFILILSLILPLISFGIMIYVGYGINVKFSVVNSVTSKYTPLPLTLQVTTKHQFMTCQVRAKVRIKNGLQPESHIETLLFIPVGYSAQTIEQDLNSEYAGTLTCEIAQIRIYDYLGLFWINKKPDSALVKKIIVLPDVFLIGSVDLDYHLQTNMESDEYGLGKVGDDPSEIVQIRNFREDDPLSKIHWKLSSKYEQLMVRDFGEPSSSNLLVLFDVNTEGIALDSLLDSVASICAYLVSHELSYNLTWYSPIYEDLMNLKISKEEDLSAALCDIATSVIPVGSPLSLMEILDMGTASHYSDVIYLCSGDGFDLDWMMNLSEALGSLVTIHVLMVTLEPDELKDIETSLASSQMIKVSILDAYDIERDLGRLSL